MGAYSIDQVMVFSDPRRSRELGRIVWSALREVETFFRRVKPGLEVARSYLGEQGPDGIEIERAGNPEEYLERFYVPSSEKDRRGARRARSRTFDSTEIGSLVRQALPNVRGKAVVVTDLELTPPKEWRYVVFDDDGSGGAVISLAPIDPLYWSVKDPRRLATIKQRVRASAMCVTAELLGLSRCRIPRCFCFQNIDSVTRLDAMVMLGEEHGIKALARHGFEPYHEEPEQVQPIVMEPRAAVVD